MNRTTIMNKREVLKYSKYLFTVHSNLPPFANVHVEQKITNVKTNLTQKHSQATALTEKKLHSVFFKHRKILTDFEAAHFYYNCKRWRF